MFKIKNFFKRIFNHLLNISIIDVGDDFKFDKIKSKYYSNNKSDEEKIRGDWEEVEKDFGRIFGKSRFNENQQDKIKRWF